MATRESASVTADGRRLGVLPEGVTLRDMVTQVDDRGSLCELIDERWDDVEEPVTSSYLWTIRPAVIKGWSVHRLKSDRYVMLFGEAEIVVWDGREDSPTYDLVAQVFLSDLRRQMLRIPPGVWHAVRGLGTRDAVLVNFPTALYDHADPDKYGMDVENDVIPYRFS